MLPTSMSNRLAKVWVRPCNSHRVQQMGVAGWGPRGRGFKSRLPDQPPFLAAFSRVVRCSLAGETNPGHHERDELREIWHLLLGGCRSMNVCGCHVALASWPTQFRLGLRARSPGLTKSAGGNGNSMTPPLSRGGGV